MKLKSLKNKYLKLLILLVIFVCSAFMRIKYFNNNSILDADMSRDLMAGMHIVKYGEFPLVGHTASGIGFYYPPYYYYGMAFLSLFTTDTVLLLKIIICWLSFSAVFTFLIADELFNIETAILAAFLEIFSYIRIMQQANLFSSTIVSPVLLITLYIFIRFVKTKNVYFFILSLSVLSIGSTISYTLFPFIPFFFFLGFYLVKKLRHVNIFIKYLFGIVLFNIILYLPLLINFKIFDTIKYFNLFNHISISFNVPLKFIQLLVNHFVGSYYKSSNLLFIVFFTHLLITIIRKKFISLFLLPLYMIIYILLFSAMKIEFVYNHFLYQIYPLYTMIFIAMVVYHKPFKQKVINYILIVIQLIFISCNLININLFSYKNNDIRNVFETAQIILENSRQITKMNNYNKLDFFTAYIYEPEFGTWPSTLIWYALEKQSGIKFVKYINYSSNFEQINSDNLVYMICRGYENDDQDTNCINDFEKSFDYGYQHIKIIESPSGKIHIFRNRNILMNI